MSLTDSQYLDRSIRNLILGKESRIMAIREFELHIFTKQAWELHTPLTAHPTRNHGWVTRIDFRDFPSCRSLIIRRLTTPVTNGKVLKRRLEGEFVRDDVLEFDYHAGTGWMARTHKSIWFRKTRGRSSRAKPMAHSPISAIDPQVDYEALHRFCKAIFVEGVAHPLVDWLSENCPLAGQLVSECGDLPEGDFGEQCKWIQKANLEWNRHTDYSTHEV